MDSQGVQNIVVGADGVAGAPLQQQHEEAANKPKKEQLIKRWHEIEWYSKFYLLLRQGYKQITTWYIRSKSFA